MEGDIEVQNSLNNQNLAFSVPSLPPQLLPASGDPDSASSWHSAPSLNPKKRIISQLAEAEAAVAESSAPLLSGIANKVEEKEEKGDDNSALLEAPVAETPTTAADPARSPPKTTNGAHAWIPMTAPAEATPSGPHPTPTSQLPPKKATVKRQVEELRKQEIGKVRMSLSEYRRRRGLSVTEVKEPPSASQAPPASEVKSTTPTLSNAPPVVLDNLPPDF
ncbi:unnamed protein product, partial [Dibothriocephalus latus]